jgi:hypothetical protein
MKKEKPIITSSTLKVTASEEFDLDKELEAENILNKSISELLEKNNDKKD